MQTLRLSQYTLYMAENLLQGELLASLCSTMGRRLALITDSNLVETYGLSIQQILQQHGLEIALFTFSAGEAYKTRDTKAQLEDALFTKQFGRDSCFLALGGGLVTDLVGFLAATYCRGVPVIYIPTTLLAMVDASIGGKTGLNTPLGKNLIGCFSQPHAVLMDTLSLKTLPANEWRNGIAEMLKHGMIADAALFEQMQSSGSLSDFQARTDLVDLIQKNCAIKQAIVEQDERENNIRQLLNFGHTIGHAIETLEDYQIGHGEAVAIGMLVECHLAVQAGYLSAEILRRLHQVLKNYGLPLKTTVFANQALLMDTLTLDKKSIRSIPRFVMLQDIGQPYIQGEHYTHAVQATDLKRTLSWAAEVFI